MQRKITLPIIMLFLVPYLYGQNVGIGTPSPDYTLDVNGQLGINDYIYHNDDTGEDTYMGFSADDTWKLVAGSNEIAMADGVADEFIVNQAGADTKLRVVGDGFDYLIITDPNTNRVGIGKATPDYLLDVGGDLRVVGDGFDYLIYADSDNDRVGLGTNNPQHLLDVGGDLRVVGDGFDYLIYADSDNNKVGIGQATPLHLLDIKGDLRVEGDGVSHLLYVDTDSNQIGVGTDTPAQMLDVHGMTRTRGLEFVSPYTGAVTTFQQMTTGTEIYTGGNATGDIVSLNVTFPTFYAGTPNVLVTVKGTDTGLESDALFVASVRSANSSGVTINLYRADGGALDDHSWTQNLIITWMAWE